VVVVATAAGVLAVRFGSPRLPKRFAVVQPGVLYRSSQPSAAQVQNLAADYGIRTIVVARADVDRRASAEIDAARKLGVKIVQLPIESGKLLRDEQVQDFLRCVDDPGNRPVLVHCSAGRHRTGYLCAMYRIQRQGWPLQEALAEMLTFGATADGPHPVVEQLKQYQPKRSVSATSRSSTLGGAAAAHSLMAP
jgi:protein tyrosine/serine phosphatase